MLPATGSAVATQLLPTTFDSALSLFGAQAKEAVMPIFMDRHDLREMTAEAVAAAHSKDLEIQDRYGVKYMTYWFDQDRGTGFCLVDAPDAATAERVHREAHGEIATDIIAVDLAVVEAFLGRINHPQAGPSEDGSVVDPAFRAV